MKIEASELVFYTPGSLGLHSIAVFRDGAWRCQYGDQTYDEIRVKNPDMQMMPIDAAIKQIDDAQMAHYCKQPVEETREDFEYALGVLPPCKWSRNETWEAFYVSEPLCGSIYTWHVRIGERFFCLNRDGFSKPEQIANEIAVFLTKGN